MRKKIISILIIALFILVYSSSINAQSDIDESDIGVSEVYIHEVITFNPHSAFLQTPSYSNLDISNYYFDPVYYFDESTAKEIHDKLIGLKGFDDGIVTYSKKYVTVTNANPTGYSFMIYPDLIVINRRYEASGDTITREELRKIKDDMNNFVDEEFLIPNLKKDSIGHIIRSSTDKDLILPNDVGGVQIIFLNFRQDLPIDTSDENIIKGYLDTRGREIVFESDRNGEFVVFNPIENGFQHIVIRNSAVRSLFQSRLLSVIEIAKVLSPRSVSKLKILNDNTKSFSADIDQLYLDIKNSPEKQFTEQAVLDLENNYEKISFQDEEFREFINFKDQLDKVLQNSDQLNVRIYSRTLRLDYTEISNLITSYESLFSYNDKKYWNYLDYGRSKLDYQQQTESTQTQFTNMNRQILLTRIALCFTIVALIATIFFNRRQISISNEQLNVMENQLKLSKKISEKNENTINKINTEGGGHNAQKNNILSSRLNEEIEKSKSIVEINQKYREEFKPEQVDTLIVGESPPFSGKYVYNYDKLKYVRLRAGFSGLVGKYSGIKLTKGNYKEALLKIQEKGIIIEDLFSYPIDFLSPKIRADLIQEIIAERIESLIKEYSPTELTIFLPSATYRRVKKKKELEKKYDITIKPWKDM